MRREQRSLSLWWMMKMSWDSKPESTSESISMSIILCHIVARGILLKYYSVYVTPNLANWQWFAIAHKIETMYLTLALSAFHTPVYTVPQFSQHEWWRPLEYADTVVLPNKHASTLPPKYSPDQATPLPKKHTIFSWEDSPKHHYCIHSDLFLSRWHSFSMAFSLEVWIVFC